MGSILGCIFFSLRKCNPVDLDMEMLLSVSPHPEIIFWPNSTKAYKRGGKPGCPSQLRFIFNALTSLAAITEACQKHAKVIWLMTPEMDHPDVYKHLAT